MKNENYTILAKLSKEKLPNVCYVIRSYFSYRKYDVCYNSRRVVAYSFDKKGIYDRSGCFYPWTDVNHVYNGNLEGTKTVAVKA